MTDTRSSSSHGERNMPPPASPATLTPLQAAVARNNAEAFARMEDKILPEVWEIERWLLASLLALNSAAGATIYSSAAVPELAKYASCWFFIAGALCALASGFVQTFQLRRLGSAVTAWQHYWSAVAGGAPRTSEMEASNAAAARLRVPWLPQVFLLLSVASFIFGISLL